MVVSRILLLNILICGSFALASEFEDMFIARGLDGELTNTSRINLALLQSKARESGNIKLWVMFDMAHQPNPAQQTENSRAVEAREKAMLIKEIVSKSPGIELQREHKGLRDAPGVLLLATEDGLVSLASNSRVRHITLVP